MAFHGAIIDDCNRAAGVNQSDAMALRLRNNALALAKIQLAMLALTGAEPTMAEPEPELWRDPEPVESLTADAVSDPTVSDPSTPDPLASDPLASDPLAFDPLAFDPQAPDNERVLAGDALSRFVSRPLAADESPHQVWRQTLESEPIRRQRNPVLPGAGFRSPSA